MLKFKVKKVDTFVSDPIIDSERAHMKREYDNVFNDIHEARVAGKDTSELLKKERSLYEKSKAFIRKNALYYSKMRDHFRNKVSFESDTMVKDDPNEIRGPWMGVGNGYGKRKESNE